MITKAEASDLKSLTDRLVSTELELQNATFARDQAKRILESWMWQAQQPAEVAA
jgi:hypothetical protein